MSFFGYMPFVELESSEDEEESSTVYVAADSVEAAMFIESSEQGSSTSSPADDRLTFINEDVGSEIIEQEIERTGLDTRLPIEDTSDILVVEPTPSDSFIGEDAERDSATVPRRFADGDELSSGMTLSSSEKPKIIAIMAKNIINGFPEKNILFIKKFTSTRGYVEKYSIFRKKMFIENDFEKIKEISDDKTNIPLELAEKLLEQNNNLKISDLFMFEDSSLENNQVYLYKITIKWNLGTEEEIRLRTMMDVARQAAGDNFLLEF